MRSVRRRGMSLSARIMRLLVASSSAFAPLRSTCPLPFSFRQARSPRPAPSYASANRSTPRRCARRTSRCRLPRALHRLSMSGAPWPIVWPFRSAMGRLPRMSRRRSASLPCATPPAMSVPTARAVRRSRRQGHAIPSLPHCLPLRSTAFVRTPSPTRFPLRSTREW